MYGYFDGELAAYIELLRTGIRDVCMLNYGVFRKNELNFVKRKAKRTGFYSLLITHDRVGNTGRKFKSYGRLIYTKEGREKAYEIKRLLIKKNKTKKDHVRIGRLFGYKKDKVMEFVYKNKRGQ